MILEIVQVDITCLVIGLEASLRYDATESMKHILVKQEIDPGQEGHCLLTAMHISMISALDLLRIFDDKEVKDGRSAAEHPSELLQDYSI